MRIRLILFTIFCFLATSASAEYLKLDTPENTVQSYAKAFEKMDIEGIRSCLSNNSRSKYDKEMLSGRTPSEIEEYRKATLTIFNSTYRKINILDVQKVSELQVNVETKTEFYDATYTTKYEEKIRSWTLIFEDNKWKIDIVGKR
jgi:hypothetical protein